MVIVDFLHHNLIKTAIAIATLIVINFAIEFFFIKRIDSKRRKGRIKALTRNSLLFIGFFFLAKIWVEGFSHLLTVMGFIGAGLTITQKENVLNLTGWLIIMWRNTFSEGDYISIHHISGFVKSIGPFYFTLEETKDPKYLTKKGNDTRVPNAYVSMYPFTVLAQEHISTFEDALYFQFESDVNFLQKVVDEFNLEFTLFLANLREKYTKEEKRGFDKLLKRDFSHTANCELDIHQNEIKGYALNIHCLSVVRDFADIHTFINSYFIKHISSKKLTLVSE